MHCSQPLVEGTLRHSSKRARQAECLAHRQVGEQAASLGNVDQAATGDPLGRVVADDRPVEHDDTGHGRDHARDGPEGRGLAGSVRTQQGHDLAGVDREVEPDHDGDPLVPGAQSSHLEQRAHAAPLPRYAWTTRESSRTTDGAPLAMTRP